MSLRIPYPGSSPQLTQAFASGVGPDLPGRTMTLSVCGHRLFPHQEHLHSTSQLLCLVDRAVKETEAQKKSKPHTIPISPVLGH